MTGLPVPTRLDPALRAVHVSVTFPSPEGGLGALADMSFAIGEGQFVCFLGPSGCGKSTLLRVLAGLLPPTRGQINLYGRPVDGPSSDVGIVFQKANLMPWRTVLKNIMLPLEVQRIELAAARQRAIEMVELVGLAGFASSYPDELSGGMAQRVGIARALIHDPAILLLDEPFGALDALTRERMNLELLRIWEVRRKTVVMVTHNVQEALLLSDRVMVMSERPGRIVVDLEVDLPRPRTEESIYSEQFTALSRCIHQAIRVQEPCDSE